MNIQLSGDMILQPTPWCTIREQEERYLIYNSRTDELHLVPVTGHYAYSLCDGLRTMDEVQAEIEKALSSASTELQQRLHTFLGSLVQRGILEVADEF